MLDSSETRQIARSKQHPVEVNREIEVIKKLSKEITNESATPMARNNVAQALWLGHETKRAGNEAKKAKKFEELSEIDPLTGFSNRRHLGIDEHTKDNDKKVGQLEIEFDRAVRYKHDLVIAVVDLDSFKVVNDTYGHSMGDELIKTFAKVVIDTLRKEDVKARIGGDEFCLVFPESRLQQVQIVIERIRKKYIEAQKSSCPGLPEQSLSIGLSSLLSNKSTTYNELLEFADKATYVSKKTGKNKVIVYGDSEFNQSIIK